MNINRLIKQILESTINNFLLDHGKVPTNNAANDFKQIVTSVTSENRELPLSINTIADNFFFVLESKLHLQYADLNLLNYHTEVFNQFFKDVHLYNNFIIQDLNSFNAIFKGAFIFVNESTVLQLYKSQIVSEETRDILSFPSMIKLNLSDAIEVPLSKLYLPTEIAPSNRDLFNKLSRLKEWLQESLNQEILPSVDLSTQAVLESQGQDLQKILETITSTSDLLVFTYCNSSLDQSIANLFPSCF